MTDQTLGRRNAAPVQGTELDLDSGMLVRHVKELTICTQYAERPQGATRYYPGLESGGTRGSRKGLGRPEIDGPAQSPASRELRLPQDLGHRRLSGPPPG